MKRIYHHCDVLEDTPMWRPVIGSDADLYADRAADLMRESDAFKIAMQQALKEWPLSCEHNLSAKSINRKAWLGHAGCFLATESPESCTRIGWHQLDADQQDLANQAADEVIKEWEQCQRSD
jgi:hypothetical protein